MTVFKHNIRMLYALTHYYQRIVDFYPNHIITLTKLRVYFYIHILFIISRVLIYTDK